MIDVDFRDIDHKLRSAIPQCVLVCFLFLPLIVLPFPHTDYIKPQFMLMGIYYWAIYRPVSVSAPFCFVLGLATDLLTGAVPGIHAILFVLLQWSIRDQRRFLMGQPYITLWAVFGVVVLAVSSLQWMLFGLAASAWSSFLPVFVNSLVSFLIFPLITIMLVSVHRLLPVASHGYH